MENILLKNKENKEMSNKTESSLNLEINLINKDLDSNEKNNDINEIDEDEDEEDGEDKKLIKLPKLRFYDFFFNFIYCKCCPFIQKQKLIDSCAQILYKHFSVENLLYNQILFENLMKDYHWNDPQLKSIQNNSLIEKLKQYV